MVTFFFCLCGPASAFSTNIFGVRQRGAPVGGPNSSLAVLGLETLESRLGRPKRKAYHTARHADAQTKQSPLHGRWSKRSGTRGAAVYNEASVEKQGSATKRRRQLPKGQNLPSCHLLCLPASPEQSRTREEKVDIHLQLWPLPPAPRSCASSLRDHRRPPNRSSSSKVRFAAPLPLFGSRSKCRDTELKP